MFKDSTSKRLRLMLLLVLLAFIFCGSQSAFGMPPHPDLKKQFKEKKKPIPAFIRNPEILRQRGIDNPAPRPGLRQRILQDEPAQGPSGSFRALALLVDFSDRTSQVSASYFDTLIFASTGSTVRSYYNEVSYGTLTIVTVNLPSTTGWLRAPQTYSYYVNGQNGLGTYPQNAQKLVEDAVDAANSVVNYSLYDNDANGYVDALFVVHAGPGAEYTGSFNDIWSHQWSISPRLRDGVYISTYSMEPEYWLSPNDMTSGVFCHELGHVFGLPDLYDTDDSSEGIGNWSLMAGGSWNGVRGNSPAHLDAWSRIYLDFASTTLVSADSIGLSITAVETTPQIYYLWDCDPTSDEYFLLENRQPVGFDAALPGSGLLIWHIDEGMTTNRNECLDHQNCNCVSHYKVALEQADGALDLEYGLDRGDSGDPFPGSTNKRAFDLSTTPNPGSYASCDSNIEISNISNSASTMTVDVHTCTAPNGLFFPYLEFPVASKPVAVAIGDVNNDARNDVVVTTTYENDPANDHRIHVFLQDASGSLQTPAVKYLIDPAFFTYHSQSVDIGDLNNDGRSDVVVSAQDSVGVFHQNGAGTLEPMVSYPCGHSSIRNAYQVRIGDFNNDGLLDVVSIDEGFESNDADVFLQNAGGTLDEPVTYVVEHGGYDDLDVGDVNGDGLQDIIVMSGYGGYSTLGILLQNASGTLDPAVYYDLPVAANARGVAVGDIDGDTLDDVAVTYGVPTEYVGVFYQNITGTLDPAISYPTMNVSDAVETEDLDNDLLNDIVVAHSAWVYLGVYRHDVAGELLPEEYYPIPAANGTSPHGMAIGDLNSDGGNDVAIVSDLSGLTVLYNTSPVSPTIALSTFALSSSTPLLQNAPSQTFEVWNSGAGTLSYTVSWNVGFFSCVPITGTSTGEHDTITVNYNSANLSAGTYSGTITITDSNALNNPQTILVTLTILQSTIARSPTSLTNTCSVGYNAPNQSFEVWNSGGATLSYTISDNVTWLACAPTTGTSTGEHDTITVTYSTSALARGTYTGTITIMSDSAASNSPQTIPVTLTVVSPTIARSPTTLTNTCLLATNASSQTFDVWNSGAGILSYSISDNADWLSCSPASGTSLTNEHDTIAVNYATASLPVGTHSATITISDPNATNNPLTISVNLTVWKPTITLSTNALSKTVRMGLNASNQTFQVRNSGTGTLSYTISDNADWLACTPASGTSTTENDTISVVYTTYALAVGNYSATITVADANASNNPQTISVSLEVVQPTISRNPTTIAAACAPGENAVSQSFEVWNTGVGTLSYTITDNSTWMSCSPTSGASLGEHDTITIIYDTSAVAVGKYTGTITISDPNATNTPQTIVVTLTVGPTISRNPTTLTNNSQTGQDAAAQSFEVWNSGMGTLAYTITSDVAWLTCNPVSGTSTGEHDTLAVSYGTAALLRGTYRATITISSASATNTPQTIPVTLTVIQPTIARSPTTLTNTCLLATNAASQTFDVWNSGSGTLSYAISDNADWLSCSPASGTSLTNEHDVITVSYATASLPVGAHSAIITISDPNST
ncbi:M6 family metalloprotease domain-containing protein, partial [Candidatus Poribacteria bacterium]|nr:M6 family metalloprotease domain-containing protein [Candidatus Poribacteria bacterium]